MNQNLPTEKLKEYGIINLDNSFSKKMSKEDIEDFLKGFPMIVEDNQKGIIFQLKENNTQLDVNFFQRKKNLSQTLEQSQKNIAYDLIEKRNENGEIIGYTKSAFFYDQEKNLIIEKNLIKDSLEIINEIAERKNAVEFDRYKNELLKLKEFLQEKIDKFPEIAKEITNDLNIVSKTINTIDDTTPNQEQSQKQQKSDIQLNVNDLDRYQDANQEREKKWEQEQERKRGFRR